MRSLSILCIILIIAASNVLAAPRTGQIVVDPNHPARMVYHNTYEGDYLKPVVFVGPGDPEDFFYDDPQYVINQFNQLGAKSTYITAYLVDFGGGSPGAGSALDATLNTWENYITQLENAGVITLFFFFDDGKGLHSGWETDIDKIVNKFEHHKLLIWSVAEEYGEALSKSQVSAVAARIKAADDYDHVVAVHQNSSARFDFNSDSNIDMFAMQYNVSSASAIHSGIVSAWNNVAGNKIINLAEVANHGTQSDENLRKWNWAAVMGGASAVQVLLMGRFTGSAGKNTPKSYEDCRILSEFMESFDFNALSPHDELAHAGTRWVLAQPGVAYLAYSDNLADEMGIKGMNAGTYHLTWLDIPTGNRVTEQVTAGAGDQAFAPPPGFGTEVALYMTNYAGSEDPQLASIAVSPDTAAIILHEDTTFFAVSKDQYGQNYSTTITWSVSAGGTMNPNGRFLSNGTAGTFTVRATSQEDTSVSGSALINVFAAYPAPVAESRTISTPLDQPVSLSLPYSSESPGPFEFVITKEPDNGILNVLTNDAAYTPDSSYVGTDTYKFRVKDLYNGSNALSNEATVTIEVTDQVTPSNTSKTNYVWDVLDNGKKAYIDRDYTISAVPADYVNSMYLQTANNDKGSTGNPFLSFDINAPVAVYVAFDDRISSKPSWLAGFTDSGDNMMVQGVTYSLLRKDFPAGTVTLGGNEGAGNSMYLVILGAEGGDPPVDLARPAPPGALKILRVE